MSKTIQLAHGGGGRLSRDLIEELIVPRFGQGPLANLPDAARLTVYSKQIVVSTDSFVVKPTFFPGGNIGDLAVYGTVNDVAVCGGKPLWLSLALILEEGLEIDRLEEVLDAAQAAAARCGVTVVTGDTKVVHRGQCDRIYITSTGIGEALPGFNLSQNRLTPGDVVLVSGPIAEHGVAVMAAREELKLENGPLSDTGPVHTLVLALNELAHAVKFMRDPTRGGVAAVLNELVENQPFGIQLNESQIPVRGPVHAVCEMLGLDPLHIACEGRLIAVCAKESAAAILERWLKIPEGKDTEILGSVSADVGKVVLETTTGGRRLLDWPLGELLPRIC